MRKLVYFALNVTKCYHFLRFFLNHHIIYLESVQCVFILQISLRYFYNYAKNLYQQRRNEMFDTCARATASLMGRLINSANQSRHGDGTEWKWNWWWKGVARWCCHNGLFTLLDSDSDSDSKPNVYTALCRSLHIAQSQIQIPILTVNYRNRIGSRVRNRVRLPQFKSAITWKQTLTPKELAKWKSVDKCLLLPVLW